MAKINLSAVLGSFLSVTGITDRLQQIEDEFNNKVLYRDNPQGEPNQMENDLDVNNNDLLNVRNILGGDGKPIGGDLYSDGRQNMQPDYQPNVPQSLCTRGYADGKLNPDGSLPMNPGYSPVNGQDIATLESVRSIPVTPISGNNFVLEKGRYYKITAPSTYEPPSITGLNNFNVSFICKEELVINLVDGTFLGGDTSKTISGGSSKSLAYTGGGEWVIIGEDF